MLSGELRIVSGKPENARFACRFVFLATHRSPLIVAADFED